MMLTSRTRSVWSSHTTSNGRGMRHPRGGPSCVPWTRFVVCHSGLWIDRNKWTSSRSRCCQSAEVRHEAQPATVNAKCNCIRNINNKCFLPCVICLSTVEALFSLDHGRANFFTTWSQDQKCMWVLAAGLDSLVTTVKCGLLTNSKLSPKYCQFCGANVKISKEQFNKLVLVYMWAR